MRTKLPFALVTIVLLSLLFSAACHLGFAYVDDPWMLLDQKIVSMTVVDQRFVENLFLSINSLQYSPINTIYYWLIYRINGYDAYYYHLFSLFIHFLNVGLTYYLIKKILELLGSPNSAIVACGVALTWAILPFNTQPVIWVSASKVLLYTFWGHISFVCFLMAYTKQSKFMYMFSLVSLVFSCLAKEQAVLYALMIALFVWLHQSASATKMTLKKYLVVVGPFLLVALFFGLVTIGISIYGPGSLHVTIYPWQQRFILAFYCLCFYALNCFIPVKLRYQYAFPMKPGEHLPFEYYIYPFVVGFMIWLIYALLKDSRYKTIYCFSFGIFIIHLLLCLQIAPLPRGSMLGDRYMYIPSIGALLFIATLLNEKFDLSFKMVSKRSTVLLVCFGMYILLLCLYSHSLVTEWTTMQL